MLTLKRLLVGVVFASLAGCGIFGYNPAVEDADQHDSATDNYPSDLGCSLEVEEVVDQYGVPERYWRWTYDLIDGEVELFSCEGLYPALEDSAFPTISGISLVNSYPTDSSVRQIVSEIYVSPHENFILEGSGFWQHLQIRVNGQLVRHRDAIRDYVNFVPIPPLIQFDTFFMTEELYLHYGRNEITVIAVDVAATGTDRIMRTYCTTKTVYIVLENES